MRFTEYPTGEIAVVRCRPHSVHTSGRIPLSGKWFGCVPYHDCGWFTLDLPSSWWELYL